jgi:cysteine desulfurase/selenocysteine lyase
MDFPILSEKIRDKNLVYLDNAATTQKPKVVIDTIVNYYMKQNSNIHRGVHLLSQISTYEYEKVRKKIKKFLNASSEKEIIYTRGTTESINLVASSWGRHNLNAGDEIIISQMEHHSNIVPWQILAQEKQCKLKIIPINDKGEIIFEEFEKMFNDRTKLLSIVHVSNSLGTVNPVREMIQVAHSYGVPALVDGAQSIQHMPVDVIDLDCDFYAFSGHKLYGPTGIGVLYGKQEYLEKMPPYQGGGDMISSVKFEKTIFNELPYKFEAGTPNIEGVIGLGKAIDYVLSLGFHNIIEYEKELTQYGMEALSQVKGLKIIGEAENKSSVNSFVLENVHPHDIGTMLDMDGIAVRTGHHCTEPVMHRFKVPATTRASIAFYNTKEEIDVPVKSLEIVIKMFS